MTGHTRLLLLLDKASSRRAGIVRVFVRLHVLSVAFFCSINSALRIRALHGFSALRGLPALRGRPSLFREVCSVF